MPHTSYRFANVLLSPLERQLTIDGHRVAVGARAFDVLLALIERRDRLVTRDELLDLVWPDIDVEPNNLAVQIGALRKVLGPQLIVTIPGRGYRFSTEVDEQSRSAPPIGQTGVKTNLPEQLSPLIGRDDDLRSVDALIDAQRIVTIVGGGGIGKTRLAQRLLHGRRNRYQHGVCWVELAPLLEPSTLPTTIAAALGINLGSGDPHAVLMAALATLEILIGVDNAEHMAGAIGRLIEGLIAASPGVRFLITSQVPLHLPDEQTVRLNALAFPPAGVIAAQALRFGAVELFVQRARAADARFALNDGNVAAVIRLCERLDGLPLAIEFAAARSSLLGIERVVASLDERLEILKGHSLLAPPRQQTMRATLEWSHQLLAPEERVVFRRLAVLAGSASLELIQDIVADTDHSDTETAPLLDRWTIVDALAGLVDRSLVALLTNERDFDRPRYRLLETPRAFASEQLEAANERALLEQRRAHAMSRLLAQAWIDRYGGAIGTEDWNEQVESDRENAWLAFEWAFRRRAFDLVLAMVPVLLTRSRFGTPYDARATIADNVDQWLATQAPASTQLWARIQLMHFWLDRKLSHSLLAADQARSIATACGDRFAAYVIEAWSVRIHLQLCDFDTAAIALERATALERPEWPAARLYIGAEARSTFFFMKGPSRAALESVRHELRLARLAGSDGRVAASHLLAVELAAGDYASAAANAYEQLDQLRDSRNQFAVAHVRLNLLGALLALNDPVRARPVALATWRTARSYELHGDCADLLALLCAVEGRWYAAATLAGYADAIQARSGAKRWPNELVAHERVVEMTVDALGAAEFERIRNEGTHLPDIGVSEVAFREA